jgi:hypothetical protein
MNPTNASRALRFPQSTRHNGISKQTTVARSTTTMSSTIQLIHEALSRARMRRPQETNSEAYRSARQITMHARRETNRWLGE